MTTTTFSPNRYLLSSSLTYSSCASIFDVTHDLLWHPLSLTRTLEHLLKHLGIYLLKQLYIFTNSHSLMHSPIFNCTLVDNLLVDPTSTCSYSWILINSGPLRITIMHMILWSYCTLYIIIHAYNIQLYVCMYHMHANKYIIFEYSMHAC